MKRFLICLIVLVICGGVFDARPQSFEKQELTVVLTVNSDNEIVKELMRRQFLIELGKISDLTVLSDSKKTHAYDYDANWDFWIDITIVETESKKYAVSTNEFFRVPSTFIVESIRHTFSKNPGVFAFGSNLLMVIRLSDFAQYCVGYCSALEQISLKQYRERGIR